MQEDKALRYNEGKLRYDLINPQALEGLVKVFTFGAQKYAPRNWEKGMAWSKVIASLKRHLAAIEKGEDIDQESGFLHADHLQWNSHVLSAYYSIYPQGDDRQHQYLYHPKIGLDVDEVLCAWAKAWSDKFGYNIPETWHFSYNNKEHFESFTSEELDQFYLHIPAKILPEDIPFEPHCYITSRSVPVELTEKWIQLNKFPTRPVYSVGLHKSKVDVAIESGIDVFIDDAFHNFVELNRAGICTYLWDAPHNQRYNVGHKRIKTFTDLPWFKTS